MSALCKTVVIGLGNPSVTDDGVGVVVAREVGRRLRHRPDVETTEVNVGGLRLMEAMAGFDRAIVVDALKRGGVPGSIALLELSDCVSTHHSVCVHDMNLATALALGTLLGIALPTKIRLIGIEVQDADTFGESLTEAVARAVPVVVDQILNEIASPGVAPTREVEQA